MWEFSFTDLLYLIPLYKFLVSQFDKHIKKLQYKHNMNKSKCCV